MSLSVDGRGDPDPSYTEEILLSHPRVWTGSALLSAAYLAFSVPVRTGLEIGKLFH